jgi:hypothetical protein
LDVTRGSGAKYTIEYAIIIARSSKYKVMECRVHGKDAEARFFERDSETIVQISMINRFFANHRRGGSNTIRMNNRVP